jgi:hypothetical protein
MRDFVFCLNNAGGDMLFLINGPHFNNFMKGQAVKLDKAPYISKGVTQCFLHFPQLGTAVRIAQ